MQKLVQTAKVVECERLKEKGNTERKPKMFSDYLLRILFIHTH